MSSKLDQFRNNIAQKLKTRREFIRILLAELLGTLILVAVGDGSVAQMVLSYEKKATFLTVCFAYALAIAFGVYICGGVSGGHINPAVSLCMCLFGRTEWSKLPAYFIGQFFGAFLGSVVIFTAYYNALVAYDAHMRSITPELFNYSYWVFPTAGIYGTYPEKFLSAFGGLYDQIIGTAILLLVVFAVTDPRNMQVPKHLIPLLVGLGVGAIGMSYGFNCGFAINPARDLAPRFFTLIAGWGPETFSHRDGYFSFFWAPVVGPFIGAILGALLYQALVGIHWPPIYEAVKIIDEPRGQIVETVITEPKGKTVS